jgi:hypothetical protein
MCNSSPDHQQATASEARPAELALSVVFIATSCTADDGAVG